MPQKQKSKKTTNLQDHATRMINRSALLTLEAKKKWLSRIPNLSEQECQTLIQGLYKEFSFLTEGLKTTLKTLLEKGDEKNLRLFDQLLRKAKKSLREIEEKSADIQEGKTLTSLEQKLSNI